MTAEVAKEEGVAAKVATAVAAATAALVAATAAMAAMAAAAAAPEAMGSSVAELEARAVSAAMAAPLGPSPARKTTQSAPGCLAGCFPDTSTSMPVMMPSRPACCASPRQSPPQTA